jgi:hypothetical protein
MANHTTVLDTIEITDLEDNSQLRVEVRACSELGNRGVPGLQISYLGYLVNFEPIQVERWAYQARKAGQDALLLDQSWDVHQDQYVRNFLVLGTPLRARVHVKTRSRTNPLVREYPLPFALEE